MIRKALTLTVLFLGVSSMALAEEGPQTLDEAKALAAERGSLLLVDFYAVWCGPCKAFDAAAKTDAALKSALATTVLFKVDAEKGDGVALAKSYGVDSYPAYVLLNSQGKIVDRWLGFAGAADFVKTLEIAQADPTTFDDKKARFAEDPTAEDAAKLARIYLGMGQAKVAVKHLRKAHELDGDPIHVLSAFGTTVRGYRQGQFSVKDIKEAAQAVLAAEGVKPQHVVEVALMMRDIAQASTSKEAYEPYLKAAFEASAGVTEGWVPQMRQQYLAVDHALIVEKNAEKAVGLKRGVMPEGWRQDPARLNSFAWWCFQNEVNLDEAYSLALSGVKLAEDGVQRANILDTAAEICNLREDCAEAVELIRQARTEDPVNEYYAKQLARFEERLAMLGPE